MSETIVRIKGQTQCVYELRVARQRIAALEAEVERLMRHLESLTPGGSEFHNDPTRCVLWATQQREGVIHQVKLRKAVEAEVERLRKACEPLYQTEWPHRVFDIVVDKNFELAELFARVMHDIHAALEPLP